MTATEVWAPSRRPVLRASLAVAAVAVLALAGWWAGLLTPRVSLWPELRTFDEATLEGEGVVRIENDALGTIRVESVHSTDPSIEVRMLGADVPVPGFAERSVRVAMAYRCEEPGGDPELRLRVRTWSGVPRTVDADGFDWPSPC